MDNTWAWISVAALGAFHGLNPAMGWLFAVAKGFQEKRTRSVALALIPIAAGHALAIGLVAILITGLDIVIPEPALLIAIGIGLLGFAAFKVITRFRHPQWVRMQAGVLDLVVWSFLMATAHGAGLMIAPILAEVQGTSTPGARAGHDMGGHAAHMEHIGDAGAGTIQSAIGAVMVHSLAMLLVAGVLALLVYRKFGVCFLRRAWFNPDFIWVGAFVATGLITLCAGLWSISG